MSYSNPLTITYSYGNYDFGTATEVTSLKGPSGKRGELREIIVCATETFTATTTDADVQVGTAADPNAYAELTLGTLADTDSLTATATSGAIIEASIPADTQVEVTFTAPTGGTPAGMADVHIVIDWY